MVEVVVLGSGTGIPHPLRGSPALAVRGEGELIAVDMGPGALRALVKAGFDYRQLRRVLFTHYHPDHVADLVALLFASRNRREGELHLLGPEGLGTLTSGLRSVFGSWIEPSGYTVRMDELSEGSQRIGPWNLSARRTSHTAHSLAYRLEGGGSVTVFTGDTGYDPVLVELADGADLLVAESSFPDELAVDGHLSPSRVGLLAREASVARVLLVHMYPETDSFDLEAECRRVFPGPVIVAHDLLRLEVGP